MCWQDKQESTRHSECTPKRWLRHKNMNFVYTTCSITFIQGYTVLIILVISYRTNLKILTNKGIYLMFTETLLLHPVLSSIQVVTYARNIATLEKSPSLIAFSSNLLKYSIGYTLSVLVQVIEAHYIIRKAKNAKLYMHVGHTSFNKNLGVTVKHIIWKGILRDIIIRKV